MSSITSMYRDYFQKSRVFIYPALGIKRGVSVTPVETYISWESNYDPEHSKFCTLYHLRDDQDFRTFEKHKLLGNPLFHDFKQVGDKEGVYIFDYQKYGKDWSNFLTGKYSLMSEDIKKKIRDFYGTNSPNYPYIESFLYPEKYFKMYADMMNVEEKVLREVGELCSKPDLDKETLKISIKNLEIITQTS